MTETAAVKTKLLRTVGGLDLQWWDQAEGYSDADRQAWIRAQIDAEKEVTR